MKLDAFDQAIHNRYAGHEVPQPPHIESAVMGRMARLRWARRVSGLAMAVLLGSLAASTWSGSEVPAAVEAAPTSVAEPAAAQPLAPVEAPVTEAVVDVEVAVRRSDAVPSRPVDLVDPIPHRAAPQAIAGVAVEERTLQASEAGDLWVISAEVEVKD